MEMSQLTYAHFIVLRLFKEIKGAEEQKRVAKTFRGQTVRLATHAIGARVVETALNSLPTASAALIKVCVWRGRGGWVIDACMRLLTNSSHTYVLRMY